MIAVPILRIYESGNIFELTSIFVHTEIVESDSELETVKGEIARF